jgi:hypothetical protein
MALETKPIPVLRGKAARDFWKKVENFKISETREEIREINEWVRKSMEKLREREEMERERREKDDQLTGKL